MAKLLNAEEPECFTFTSGATESNNWVFSVVSQRAQEPGAFLLVLSSTLRLLSRLLNLPVPALRSLKSPWTLRASSG